MESVLIFCDKGPYGTNSVTEAIRLGVGIGSLGEMLNTKIVLTNDAVLLLGSGVTAENAQNLHMDTLTETIEMLQLTSLPLAIVEEDLIKHGLTKDDLIQLENFSIISENDIPKLIQEYDLVLKL